MPKSDEYNIYYMIIGFLILLIFLPILLRRFVFRDDIKQNNNSGNNTSTTQSDNYKTLICNGSETIESDNVNYDFYYKYKNNEIEEIGITYKVEGGSIVDSELITMISQIKQYSKTISESLDGSVNIILYKQDENFENAYNYIKQQTLNDGTLESNKSFYENKGFTCKEE